MPERFPSKVRDPADNNDPHKIGRREARAEYLGWLHCRQINEFVDHCAWISSQADSRVVYPGRAPVFLRVAATFQDGDPERLAGGVKLDIGNPVAFAPAQADLFILALEGCRGASEQRRLYVLECVDADDGVEAAVDSAGDHRHHATRGAHVKLRSLGAERVV